MKTQSFRKRKKEQVQNIHDAKNGSSINGASLRTLQSQAELSYLQQETPFRVSICSDARSIALPDECVDLVVTSPPYWKKRDYGFDGQIGQETTPAEYVQAILKALKEWRRLLTPSGSVFLNIGDTYLKKSLAGIPGHIEAAATNDGWIIRNRIIWNKEGGMPEPASNRLANRHEYIVHLAKTHGYYYDVFGYSERFGNGSTPGDVWAIPLRRNMGAHLAPFPDELVERAITLACPHFVCTSCNQPQRRVVSRTAELDASRPQARRAMELAKEKRLTPAHIAAIQATGISDAGKALLVQTGTGKNTAEVKRLAAEAKAALGGYFREFTFPRKMTRGWTQCACGTHFRPGIVLDPFQGTGTTARVAASLGRSGLGVDFAPSASRSDSDQGRSDVGNRTENDNRDIPCRKGVANGVAKTQNPSSLRRLLVRSSDSGDSWQAI